MANIVDIPVTYCVDTPEGWVKKKGRVGVPTIAQGSADDLAAHIEHVTGVTHKGAQTVCIAAAIPGGVSVNRNPAQVAELTDKSDVEGFALPPVPDLATIETMDADACREAAVLFNLDADERYGNTVDLDELRKRLREDLHQISETQDDKPKRKAAKKKAAAQK